MSIRALVLVLLAATCSLIGCYGGSEPVQLPPSEMQRPDSPMQAIAAVRNAWWCSDNGDRLVGEVVNTSSVSFSPRTSPPRPILPGPFAIPAIPWDVERVAWFANIGVRHSFWGTATPEDVGHYLQTVAAAASSTLWGSTPWRFINYSRPNQTTFTTGEEVGLWFYRWDQDTFSLGEVALSQPQPDSNVISPRQTNVGIRRAFSSSSESWSQFVRFTCLNTSMPLNMPLHPTGNGGSGYADRVEARNLALVRRDNCWRCFNY
ncbi:hypothetical protein KBD61_03780 [Patescibacteria group bacterium]|nr:hypothetical protein [Patescibacteria group bacterium]MBP9710117.1 hypothetical protein [Patescibacteria group bacterium]